MLTDKMRHVCRTGAEVCTAGDASCLMHIGGGLSRLRTGVRTLHLAEILAATDEPVARRGRDRAGGGRAMTTFLGHAGRRTLLARGRGTCRAARRSRRRPGGRWPTPSCAATSAGRPPRSARKRARGRRRGAGLGGAARGRPDAQGADDGPAARAARAARGAGHGARRRRALGARRGRGQRDRHPAGAGDRRRRGRQGQVDGHAGDRPQRGARGRPGSPPGRPTWPS